MVLFTGGCADNSPTLSAGSARMMDVWHRQSAPTIQSRLFFIPRTAGWLNGSLSTSSPLPLHPSRASPRLLCAPLAAPAPTATSTIRRLAHLQGSEGWSRGADDADFVLRFLQMCAKLVSTVVFWEFNGATGVL